LYALFLNKGMAAFMRRTGSPKGSPHFLSAEKFIMRHAVPHDWKTRLNALHLWAGGEASIMFLKSPPTRMGGRYQRAKVNRARSAGNVSSRKAHGASTAVPIFYFMKSPLQSLLRGLCGQ